MKDFLLGMLAVALAAAVFITSTLIYDKLRLPQAEPALSDSISDTPKYSLIRDITIYDHVKDITFTYSIEDYLVGALLANIDTTCDDEVIKAQTVILYTYILSRRIDSLSNQSKNYNGADITTDTTEYLPFLPLTDADEATVLRLKTLITDVLGAYIAYDSQPIEPAFCVSCGGKTVSSADALGVDIPYLESVDSYFEDAQPLEITYTQEELFARLSSCDKGIDLYTEPEFWIDTVDATPDGYVKYIRFCDGSLLSGRQAASILNLPSAKFEVSYDGDTDLFTFTAKGQGNLMGFSQLGACKLSQLGYSWQQMISYYYTGIEIITP